MAERSVALEVIVLCSVAVYAYVALVIAWREFFSSWSKFKWFIVAVLIALVCFYYGYWQSMKFSETGKPQERGRILP